MNLADQARFAAALSAAPAAGEPRGFAVYRANRHAALCESLAISYPATERLLGAAFFRGLAREFIAVHPPRTPVLHEYGEALADVIAADPRLADYPYLADVARLEWAWQRAYHAEDATPATVQILAGWSDAALLGARLTLVPGLSLLCSSHPFATIWRMNRADSQPHAVAAWEGETVVVLRPQLEVTVETVSAAVATLLARLAEGATLADGLEQACACEPGAEPASLISSLFALGAVAAIEGELP